MELKTPNYFINREERTRLMLCNENSAHLKLESYTKAKRNLYLYRAAKFPKNPRTRNEIILCNDWTRTLDRKDEFLIANDGNEDKILVKKLLNSYSHKCILFVSCIFFNKNFFLLQIFGTESNLRILCSAEFVVSDGTFSIHPDIFTQFYVFHATYLGKVLPLLFCLLPDKTFNTYIRLLGLIIDAANKIGCRFDPKKFHIDYELAMINAISEMFSSDRVQGCLFHFSQCIWRRVQEFGLSVSYKKHKHIRDWIRRLTAIPFLPLTDIDDGFIEIVENSPDPQNEIINQEQIDKMHGYMLRTWVMDNNAKFHRRIWNQYTNDGPRTTNNAEGWNNKLNQEAKSRLSFFQFIHFLQKLQVDIDASKFDLVSESPLSRRNKYTVVNESIHTAKLNYASGTVPLLTYLDSVSIAIKLG